MTGPVNSSSDSTDEWISEFEMGIGLWGTEQWQSQDFPMPGTLGYVVVGFSPNPQLSPTTHTTRPRHIQINV